MTQRRKKLSLAFALASLAVIAAVPLLADTRNPQASSTPGFRCYCRCESKGEHHICPKEMCDLPKYENRWWAVSCHKPAAQPSTKKDQPSAPAKGHTHAILNAKR
jgi:hypothetical protein